MLNKLNNRNTILYTGLSALILCFVFKEQYWSSIYLFIIVSFIFITDRLYKKEKTQSSPYKKHEGILDSINEAVSISNLTDTKYERKIFEKEVDFIHSYYTTKIEFKNCIFKTKLKLSEKEFKNKLRFHNCTFEQEIEAENVSFFELIDFYRSEFREDQKFSRNDFYNISIFSETVFKKSVIFRHCKIKPNATYISFEKALFENGLDISNSNFWCTLQVFGIKIINTIPDKYVLEKYMSSHYFSEIISQDEKKKHTLKGLRESYRRIKQEFRINENHIEAGDFHFHEMTIFKEELDIILPKESIYYSENRFKNKIIVYLNSLSSNHKKDWTKGVRFTLITGLIFYYLFIIALVSNCYPIDRITLNEFIPHYLEFLNPTLWTKYTPFNITTSEFGAFAYTIFILGRITVGYGYYQTIQSFRKYGKN
jgi:hypothetical protein